VASDSTDQNAASSEDTKLASLEQADAKQATRKIEPQLDPRQIVLGIQQELSRLSCNPGQPDGIWGRRSQGALDNFRRSARVQLASASPDADLLNQLKDYDGKGCPVARSCPSGQRMSSRGVCYTPRQQARGMAPTQQPRSRQVIVQQPPQQQVIVQQPPQQVIVQQPVQRRVSPLGVIGGIAVGIGVCRLAGGC